MVFTNGLKLKAKNGKTFEIFVRSKHIIFEVH